MVLFCLTTIGKQCLFYNTYSQNLVASLTFCVTALVLLLPITVGIRGFPHH